MVRPILRHPLAPRWPTCWGQFWRIGTCGAACWGKPAPPSIAIQTARRPACLGTDAVPEISPETPAASSIRFRLSDSVCAPMVAAAPILVTDFGQWSRRQAPRGQGCPYFRLHRRHRGNGQSDLLLPNGIRPLPQTLHVLDNTRHIRSAPTVRTSCCSAVAASTALTAPDPTIRGFP